MEYNKQMTMAEIAQYQARADGGKSPDGLNLGQINGHHVQLFKDGSLLTYQTEPGIVEDFVLVKDGSLPEVPEGHYLVEMDITVRDPLEDDRVHDHLNEGTVYERVQLMEHEMPEEGKYHYICKDVCANDTVIAANSPEQIAKLILRHDRTHRPPEGQARSADLWFDDNKTVDQETSDLRSKLIDSRSDEEVSQHFSELRAEKVEALARSIEDAREFIANGGDPAHLVPLDQKPTMSDHIAKSRGANNAEIEAQVGPRDQIRPDRDNTPDRER